LVVLFSGYFRQYLVELLGVVEVRGTKLDQLYIGRSLIASLDETLDSRDEILDVFEIVLVSISTLLPLMLLIAGLSSLLVVRGFLIGLVAAAG
jgi:hypothetical protein